MEVADTLDQKAEHIRTAGDSEVAPSQSPSAKPVKKAAKEQSAQAKKKKAARSFWLKQLHTWHWVSAAMSLAAMFLFSITGITLNHAASIGAAPVTTQSEGKLPEALLQNLPAASDQAKPLPAPIAKAVAKAVPLDPSGLDADWSSPDEVYVAMPGPGRDAWVNIDRTDGTITAEITNRGWISYINDLHKGRNTGDAWFWFIDVFAIACIIFTLTGLLLLQLHARHRPMTWPLVGLSLIAPVLLALLFIH